MKNVWFSFDDGSKLDIELALLLKKYGFTATFFIPSNCELTADQIIWLNDNGFEIGAHTMTHPILRELEPDLQRWEILKNKEKLEELINKKVTKFCYPKGKYNCETTRILKEIGFEMARTTDVFELGLDNKLVQGVTIHVYPNRKEYKDQNWLELAKIWYMKSKIQNKTFSVFGHSWEIEKFKLWDEFEQLLKYINENQNT